MNERTVFMTAVDMVDSDQRKAYLDEACAGDMALRERVETLIRSHEREGKFLDVPAVEQLAARGFEAVASGDTKDQGAPSVNGDHSLDFLAPSDTPGSLGRFGHYEIQELIGRGGMGIVLRAFDAKLHRVVAIKMMAAQLATSATARRRFAREAQAAAAVSHDHIVTIYAVEEANPLPYLVMQYVAGLSLQERLDRDGALHLQEILRIGMQTASGLAAAHAQGLIHRDIKPANILLENGVERVKITDFGLARAAADASLTQSGIVVGTPQYMAPEQARGEAIDQRADLFSLGSLLYAMCTGRAPFRASGSVAVLKRVCEETPTPIRESNPETPDWLVAIIEKLQAKDPADRFQTAAEVADLLSRHLAHVQHPSFAPLPTPTVGNGLRGVSGAGRNATERAPYRSRRRLALAAAILIFSLGGLSLTEATGVTNLRATVIRIFTPDGTLVVEVDDPSVKVTIEGDGGIVIAGAGLEGIRLRPGSYRIQADKDGKRVPLERELVSIATGGREVVKVKLEAPAQSVAMGRNPASAEIISGPVVNPSNGHTYYLLRSDFWEPSEAAAVALGGHLVTVNNQSENDWVFDTFALFGDSSRTLWTGYHRLVPGGPFVWASGEPNGFENWFPGEPNNFRGDENYVAFVPPGQDPVRKQWFDTFAATTYSLYNCPIHGVVEVPQSLSKKTPEYQQWPEDTKPSAVSSQ